MKTVAFVTDIHSNTTVAVCPPGIYRDDGDLFQRTKTQRWLWDCWCDYIEKVDSFRIGEVITIVGGEVADSGEKHGGYHFVSKNPKTILDIGRKTITPLAEISDHIMFLRGTEAHVGTSSWIDEAVASNFDNVIGNEETKTSSWFWLRTKIEQVTFDVAHHVSMGNLPWTEKNYANYTAAKVMFDMTNTGREVPDLILRGHVHRWADSYDNYRSRCVITPAWTTATPFVRRIKPYALSQIGGLIILVDNDRYEVHKIKYEPEVRKWVTIP